jgi:hypothetical protein
LALQANRFILKITEDAMETRNQTPESHHDKFRRLSTSRMSKVINMMTLIAKLNNRRLYFFSDADLEELFGMYQKMGIAAREYFKAPDLYNEMPTTFSFQNSAPVPKDEVEKHMLFRKMAESRMSTVLQQLRLVVNLSVRSNYKYTEQEVRELFEAYDAQGAAVAGRFKPLATDFHYSDADEH